MLGYVMAYKPELRMREYEAYRAYYCGVCKAVADRFGQVPRFALSYDFAFLALLLSSLSEEQEPVEFEHCIIHPVKKLPIVRESEAINYAADMMVLLVYFNMLDDKKDEHPVRGSIGSAALRGAAKKLILKYPDVADVIKTELTRLAALEEEKSGSIDFTGDSFAGIMAGVFASDAVRERVGENSSRVLSELGRNLGRWIYLADALDDLEKDKKSGSYNPFIYREGGTDGAEDVLYACLTALARSYELLDIKKHKGILDNIIYMGLGRKSDILLGKEKGENTK
jgi:hypothetical protein